MRTNTTSGVTLQYPDVISFCFNPFLLIATGTSVTAMAVTITYGSENQSVSYDALGGACFADIREFVQGFFDGAAFGEVDYSKAAKTDLGRNMSFAVAISSGTSTVNFNFTSFVVWGALQVGTTETFNGKRKIRCWRGYPFTIGVYANGNGSVLMKKNGVPSDWTNITEEGMWNIPLTPAANADYYILSDVGQHLTEADFNSGTFDRTFDLTFLGIRVSNTDRIRIDVATDTETEGKDGVYLRWINRHGAYCYWLFKKGQEARKTATEGEFLRNNMLAYDQSYGYKTGYGRQQGYTRQDTYPICAPLVDEETWNFIFDMCTSPVVEMLVSWDGTTAKWTSVTVAAGTFSRTKDILQDFVASINLNETPLQKL